jgi:membrane-associated phospholipid phosphatase
MQEAVKIIAQYFVLVPIVAIVVVFFTLPKKRRLSFILYAAIAGLTTLLLVKIATTLHQDPRPFIRDGVKPYFTSANDNGFPSDHTVFSSLIAFIVLKYRFRTGLALALIAVMIGSARVIAGVHHGQDIVAGLLIAGASTAAAYIIILKLVKMGKISD